VLRVAGGVRAGGRSVGVCDGGLGCGLVFQECVVMGDTREIWQALLVQDNIARLRRERDELRESVQAKCDAIDNLGYRLARACRARVAAIARAEKAEKECCRLVAEMRNAKEHDSLAALHGERIKPLP